MKLHVHMNTWVLNWTSAWMGAIGQQLLVLGMEGVKLPFYGKLCLLKLFIFSYIEEECEMWNVKKTFRLDLDI